MKRIFFFFFLVLPFCMAAQSCTDDDPVLTETESPLSPSNPDSGENSGEDSSDNVESDESDDNNTNNNTPMNREIIISIGDARYTATLEDNATARAFINLLPMTVSMTEMNGNEKYYDLSGSLPTDTFRPGTIHAGDLLLWGSSTVVLFYETFSSSYSYTRLGKINDPDGLAEAVGSGSVSVTFSVAQ